MFSLSVVCTLNTQLKLLRFKRYTVLGRMVNGNFVLTPTVFQPSTPTTLWTNGSNAILLQTVQTTAFNPTSPEKLCCIRIVFDSGSQRSYVAEHVVRHLSLASEGEQSLTIMTFGANEEQACICNSVRLGLVMKDGTTNQLTLFAVPTICQPIACHLYHFARGTSAT